MVDCVLRLGFRTPCVTGLTIWPVAVDCDAAGGNRHIGRVLREQRPIDKRAALDQEVELGH
jgi:hypothetical protein